jgi:excisionase family DNA binding protein
MSEKLLKISEAAVALGISKALVYALCEQRKIRHERHGLGRGTIRIPEDALDEYRRSVTVQRLAAPVAAEKEKLRRFKHLS